MDKKDLISYFQELRLFYGNEYYLNTEILSMVEQTINNANIDKLDIKRIYRYLDRNVKKDIQSNIDDDDDVEFNEDINQILVDF
jgi:hypothetical protein